MTHAPGSSARSLGRGFGHVAAQAGGRLLRAAVRVILLVRRPRPIHAHGLLLTGSIEWTGSAAASGVSWIDQAAGARSDVVARVSRSVGLPSALPDVYGLALRVPSGDRVADMELATTGTRGPLRFLLRPRRRPSPADFGVVLPYRGTRGPVMVLARCTGQALPAGGAALAAALEAREWRLTLHHSSTLGRWHPFATMTLRLGEADVEDVRFDAGRRPLPGADTYRWVRALRQPSYDLAQTSTRGGDGSQPNAQRADL